MKTPAEILREIDGLVRGGFEERDRIIEILCEEMYAPGELAGGRKGLIEYGPQTNFPNPWPGGRWRLRDIMDYERIASDALLESCAQHREDFLRDMVARSRFAVAAFGANDAYRIPAAQRDHPTALRLARLMEEHGVEVRAADNGDVWIPLAQPYGRFVNEMLTEQRYPEVKLVAGKEIVRPYDVTAWTLPLMMGVTVERAALPGGLHPFNPRAEAKVAAAEHLWTEAVNNWGGLGRWAFLEVTDPWDAGNLIRSKFLAEAARS